MKAFFTLLKRLFGLQLITYFLWLECCANLKQILCFFVLDKEINNNNRLVKATVSYPDQRLNSDEETPIGSSNDLVSVNKAPSFIDSDQLINLSFLNKSTKLICPGRHDGDTSVQTHSNLTLEQDSNYLNSAEFATNLTSFIAQMNSNNMFPDAKQLQMAVLGKSTILCAGSYWILRFPKTLLLF